MSRDRGGDPTSWETTGVMSPADYDRIARAHARRSDPVTSSLAAASVTGLSATQERLLSLLKTSGPLTRDGLSAVWREEFPTDRTSDQSIRSRLAELMAADRVVQVGEATNHRGRRVQVVDVPRAPASLF